MYMNLENKFFQTLYNGNALINASGLLKAYWTHNRQHVQSCYCLVSPDGAVMTGPSLFRILDSAWESQEGDLPIEII